MPSKQEVLLALQQVRDRCCRDIDGLIVQVASLEEEKPQPAPVPLSTESNVLPREGHVEIKEIVRCLRICRATWYDWVKKGIMPQKEYYGEGTSVSRWDAAKIWACIGRERVPPGVGKMKDSRQERTTRPTP